LDILAKPGILGTLTVFLRCNTTEESDTPLIYFRTFQTAPMAMPLVPAAADISAHSAQISEEVFVDILAILAPRQTKVAIVAVSKVMPFAVVDKVEAEGKACRFRTTVVGLVQPAWTVA
jgi:hypothetical protein